MIDCSSRLESDLLSHDKQVEDVERIAAEEGEDVCKGATVTSGGMV